MKTKAVFLDALGTLVELEPPWVHLAEELEVEVDRRLIDAVRAEMGFYKQHAHEGADTQTLAALRARCADVLSGELGREVSVEQMMRAIRFRPYPDAGPAMAELRSRGLRLVCVSNWDISLPDVLERCDLLTAVDGVVTSAGAGARKPDSAIFEAALDVAGVRPAEALHVGDTEEEDVDGARAAGIDVLLLDRDGGGDISSLGEIPERLSA
jgi:putative hydrolase of the HAD superfamily